MKVAIVTTEDLFYVHHFFEKFFPLAQKGEKYDVVGITILPAFHQSLFGLIKRMWGFYGPWYFLLTGFRYVWRKATKRTIQNLSQEFGVTPYNVLSVNSSEYLNWLQDNSVDVIISIASPELFKAPLLRAVPKGCINSHSALLPENRGMMPVFWALYKGAETLGVTIHSMVEKLDAGMIYKQTTVSNAGESLDEMILKTKSLSAKMMHEVLCDLADGTVEELAMPSGGSYQTFPTPKEVREFLKRGNRLF